MLVQTFNGDGRSEVSVANVGPLGPLADFLALF